MKNLDNIRKYHTGSFSTDSEILEDYSAAKHALGLAKKIEKGTSDNIRLLMNHIIFFTNCFGVAYSKHFFINNSTGNQKKIIVSVLYHLGYVSNSEMNFLSLCTETLCRIRNM
jgi:hypothetical protein